MKASQRVRKGILKAMVLTGKSARQASLDAGYNENLLNLFMKRKTEDIKLNTLDDICVKGFGFSLDAIWSMGK